MRIVVMKDDFDATQDADETIKFALDGTIYSIDLTEANAKELRDLFSPYIDAAHDHRKLREHQPKHYATPAASAPAVSAATLSTRAALARRRTIRNWARSNGFEVADRGYIAARVLDAYNNAHKGDK